jgi:hypothetical protein
LPNGCHFFKDKNKSLKISKLSGRGREIRTLTPLAQLGAAVIEANKINDLQTALGAAWPRLA